MPKGKCRCGKSHFEVFGEAKFQLLCCCHDCQKMTGAGHAAIMIFSAENSVIAGELGQFTYEADNGNKVTHHFCASCGTPLFNKNSKYQNAIYVMVGALENPDIFTPERVIYTDSATKWDVYPSDIPSFGKMPIRK